MQLKRLLFFVCALSLLHSITFGQGSSYGLPKIIPPSPAAQTFMRYGEIPVDYSTGVPNIEIPIYTVEGRQLKVPISIAYHSSGIKVNDIASEVGLGWALNCGGLVSRSINGMRDERPAMPRTYDNAAALLNAVNSSTGGYDQSCMNDLRNFEDFFNRYFSTEGDPMKDRFFYKLPTGLSGIFTYDYVSGEAITLPYRHLKIEKNLDLSGTWPRIDNLTITDDNGIVYTFITVIANPSQDYSEWYIKDMTSADGTDKITFNYILQSTNPSTPSSVSFNYRGWAENYSSTCSPNTLGSSMSGTFSPYPQFTTPVLESIVSSKAIVKFEYAGRDDFNYLKRLTRITIAPVNSPTDIIKQADFSPTYFGATTENKRLGLDAITIGSPNSQQPQRYSFNYESQVLPPYPFKMNIPTYSEDYWGYYNGNNTNQDNTLIPADFIVNTFDKQPYGGNREAGDYGYAKACMLNEIKYPTGGRTVFDFERYYSSTAYPYHTDPAAQDGYYGGFRVASITNYNIDNTVANVKKYEYELPVTRQIRMEYFNYDQLFAEQGHASGDISCITNYSRDMVFSNPLLPLEVAPGMPVMYQKVTEYNGTLASNAGKTEYTYDAPYSPSDFTNNPDHPVEFEGPQFYHPYHYDKGNYVPEMNSKTIYSFDGTTYHPISKEGYIYSKLFTKTFNTGIKLSRPILFPSIDFWCFSCVNAIDCGSKMIEVVNQYKQSVAAIDTKAYQEASLLTNSKSYVYNPLDASKYVLTTTDYTYNDENLAVKEKTTTSSKGDALKTAYTYPHNNPGISVYSTMVNRNILSPGIEEQQYKNGNFLQSTKTNFDFWNGSAWSASPTNIIAPRTVESKTLGNASEVRLRYNSYDDNGNVMSVSKENDVKKTYLWGYNKNYPIAEVVNAEAKDVFHTSFEDAEGNTAGGKTGKQSRTGGYSKALSNFTNGTYVLSWWQKNGSKWELQVNANISITNGAYTINLGGQVDEVRFYPANAQMTTYAYDPLIGMISECDARNKATYYAYDREGRLQHIRDQDNNVIKYFCYNYAGQPENCSGNVFTSTQSRTYYANCTDGGVSNQYTLSYTATSGISPEDAYNKAIDYIDQHGQQEADNRLYCTWYSDERQNYIQREGCDPGFVGTWDNYLVEAGKYSSTISKADANAKAEDDLINIGPTVVGDCVPKWISAIAISSAPSNCYMIEFWDRTTGFDVWCEIPSGGSFLAAVPYGDYQITVHASCSGTRTFNIYYDGNLSSTTSSNGVNQLNIPIHDSFQIFIQ